MALTGQEIHSGFDRTDLVAESRRSCSEVAPVFEAGQVAALLATIQVEIIPRLMLAHRQGSCEPPPEHISPVPVPDAARAVRRPEPGRASVDELTELVLRPDARDAATYVHALRRRGLTFEPLMLELLAPTARRLGRLWSQDAASFTDVTLALGRLQHLFWDVSLAEQERVPWIQPRSRALIAAAPGEQHSFGAAIVAEFMRRDGWDVASGSFPTWHALLDAVRDEWFAVIGLSLSGDRGLEALSGSIRAIRCDSCNQAVCVMVGGRVFNDQPCLAEQVGADGTAEDATDARSCAASLAAKHSRTS